MLGRQVADALSRVPPEDVWSPSLRQLVADECAAVVCNLECCISLNGERTRRIPGKPFFFRAPPAAVESLQAIGIRAVSLANNHALDYEVDALADTLERLDAVGIATAGAGRGVAPARSAAPFEGEARYEAPPRRVAVVAVSDHPAAFAAAPGTPGIAWADLCAGLPEWLVGEVARASAEADATIAFPHWGPNLSAAPARWQRRRADDLLAAGADVV